MASPNRVSEVAALFSPQLRSPSRASQAVFSPDLLRSPLLGESPYRLPPIPKSTSNNDLVSGIVDKFNSLTVTDARDEERARYERQIAKLKAALERANMAREEAEEEAHRLREKLLEVQDDRVKERESLREKCTEYEKKYDKAKDRFKLQRAKNDEAMQKAQSEHLEKEKEHWRNVASAQELAEWERKLRIDASRLLDFIEVERRIDFQAARRRRSASPTIGRKVHTASSQSDAASGAAEQPLATFRRHLEGHVRLEMDVEEAVIISRPASRTHPEQPVPSSTRDRSYERQQRDEQQTDSLERPITERELHDSLREVTPEGPPSIPIRPYQTPARQVSRSIPVDFGDGPEGEEGEDKENRQPVVVQHATPAAKMNGTAVVMEAQKTPMTMDRAAALAAIEYRRRGRARSFVAGQMTPKAVAVVDKRDVSAPAMVTMTVGRKR